MLDSLFFKNKSESISPGKFVNKNDSKIEDEKVVDGKVDVIILTFVANWVGLLLFLNSGNCEGMNEDDKVDVIGEKSVIDINDIILSLVVFNSADFEGMKEDIKVVIILEGAVVDINAIILSLVAW